MDLLYLNTLIRLMKCFNMLISLTYVTELFHLLRVIISFLTIFDVKQNEIEIQDVISFISCYSTAEIVKMRE